MNSQLIYDQLPASWNDVTLSMFQKITSVEIEENEDVFNGVQNTLAIISKLTDVSVDELEDLPLGDLQKIAKKMDFITIPPTTKNKTGIIKWKELESITYNDYLTFIQLREKMVENLHVFVKNFSKEPMSDEEILSLPIEEVLLGFFLLKTIVQKYLNSSIQLEKKILKKLARLELKQTKQS